MDFRVTVRTYTGQIRTVDVSNMPNEEAARAEAIAMTFGRVLSVERTDAEPNQPKPKVREATGPKQKIERELQPGEVEVTITGYNNNPLALFSNLNITYE